ncbi:hypothetical protein ACFQPA_03415 [Halomarina halobia]|nr:hypothetical protein [Halomarina sp. PSR21]
MGSTLREIRCRIEDLSTLTGDFVVQCARTGERPAPVFRRRFPDRQTATEAARLGEEYRAELRRYDPRVPHHDLVVSEAMAPAGRRSPPDAPHRRRPPRIAPARRDGHRGATDRGRLDAHARRGSVSTDRPRPHSAAARSGVDPLRRDGGRLWPRSLQPDLGLAAVR